MDASAALEWTYTGSSLGSSTDGNEEGHACWLCLGGEDECSGSLVASCSCHSLRAHRRCLAEWQLHRAGTPEEHFCRFCNKALPDWKVHLTPAVQQASGASSGTKAQPGEPSSTAQAAQQLRAQQHPVIRIVFKGRSYFLRVAPGTSQEAFERTLADVTGVSEAEVRAMRITFKCSAPHAEKQLALNGMGAFGAVMHCASVTAPAGASSNSGAARTSGRPKEQGSAWLRRLLPSGFGFKKST